MTLDTTLPPPLFDLNAAEYHEHEPAPRTKPAPTTRRLYNAENPFRWACSHCGRKITGDKYVGGGSAGGSWLLCQHCAAKQTRPDGSPLYGITESTIAIDKIRASVYTAGGGETEVTAELTRQGIAPDREPCAHGDQCKHPDHTDGTYLRGEPIWGTTACHECGEPLRRYRRCGHWNLNDTAWAHLRAHAYERIPLAMDGRLWIGHPKQVIA